MTFPPNLKYRTHLREHGFFFEDFSSAAVVEIQNVLDIAKDIGTATKLKAHATYFSAKRVLANTPHALWITGPFDWVKFLDIPPGDIGRIAIAFPRTSPEGQEWVSGPEDMVSLNTCDRIEIKILSGGKSTPLLTLTFSFDASNLDGSGMDLMQEN